METELEVVRTPGDKDRKEAVQEASWKVVGLEREFEMVEDLSNLKGIRGKGQLSPNLDILDGCLWASLTRLPRPLSW